MSTSASASLTPFPLPTFYNGREIDSVVRGGWESLQLLAIREGNFRFPLKENEKKQSHSKLFVQSNPVFPLSRRQRTGKRSYWPRIIFF